VLNDERLRAEFAIKLEQTPWTWCCRAPRGCPLPLDAKLLAFI
jgi:hypothetical protein